MWGVLYDGVLVRIMSEARGKGIIAKPQQQHTTRQANVGNERRGPSGTKNNEPTRDRALGITSARSPRQQTTGQANVANERRGSSGTMKGFLGTKNNESARHDSRFTGRGWRDVRLLLQIDLLEFVGLDATVGMALLLDATGDIRVCRPERVWTRRLVLSTGRAMKHIILTPRSCDNETLVQYLLSDFCNFCPGVERRLQSIQLAEMCVRDRVIRTMWKVARLLGNWWRQCSWGECKREKIQKFHLNYLKKRAQQKRRTRKATAQIGETGTEPQVAGYRAPGETGTVHVPAGRRLVQPRGKGKRGGMVDMPVSMVPARLLSEWWRGFGQDLGPNPCSGRAKGKHSIFNRIFKGEKREQQSEHRFFEGEMQYMQHREPYPITVRLCMTEGTVVLEHGGRLYP